MNPLLLLGLSLSPLFQSARNLEESGRCDAALPLFMQLAFTPGAPERAEALLGGARCALILQDTGTARLLLARFLESPDPHLPLLQEAWGLLRRTFPEGEALETFAPFLFVLPTDSLKALLPKIPDSLRFALVQELRSRGASPDLPEDLPCPWILHEFPEDPRAFLCQGDTLRAIVKGSPPEPLLPWLVQDSLRCVTGAPGVAGCRSSLHALMLQTPDSARDSVLRLFERWGKDWPEVRARWRAELRWEETGARSSDFLPREPAPEWERRMFTEGLFLSPETLLARARRLWVLESWPPPRTGNPVLDRRLFDLHFLRWKRDRFWGHADRELLDSLVSWMGDVDSLPYGILLELALAADLPRPPVSRIPITDLTEKDVLLLARFLGGRGMEGPFRQMLPHLRKDLARKVAFTFFVEANQADSAFRFLNIRSPDELRAYLTMAPPGAFQEAFSLYAPRGLQEELPLLARALNTFSELPDAWAGFLARPIPDSLRVPLARSFLRKALREGDLHRAGVFALHVPDAPESRIVRYLLGVETAKPPVDSVMFAHLPETLRIHWIVDTLRPFPSLDSLPAIRSPGDRLRLLLTMVKQDSLLPEYLQGTLPRELRKVGMWLHRKAKTLYREGNRSVAGRIWRFLLRAEDRELQALALYHLGILEKDERRFDRATAFLDRLFRHYADISETWKEGAFLLAGVYGEQQEPRRALEVLRTLKGLVRGEEEGERRYFEMQAWKALGNHTRAVLMGEDLLARHAREATGWAITAALDVAQFWVIRGRPDRARTILETVVQQFPGHPLARTAEEQLRALSELERFRGR